MTDHDKRETAKAVVNAMAALDAAQAAAKPVLEPGNHFHRKNPDGSVTCLVWDGSSFQAPKSIDLDGTD